MTVLRLHTEIERWPLTTPFRLTGFTFEAIEVVVVSLEKDGRTGRGEAVGVYYKHDTPSSINAQIETVRGSVEAGVDRSSLQSLLPPGGARNAVDCALWDLDAKFSGRHAWQLAGLSEPKPILTTLGCGADEPKRMAAVASSYTGARAIKIKLTGEPLDADRVRAVREVKPDVWLAVDANQGFSRQLFERLMPTLVEAHVEMIEQPFPVGQEALLDGFESPIPIAADESVQSLKDIALLPGRFDAINIKLDKCGGLTEGLAMARAAHRAGLETMVGNMIGTSLAMAPAFLLGQLCRVVDLDGPLFLRSDRAITVGYADGLIRCPPEIWGNTR